LAPCRSLRLKPNLEELTVKLYTAADLHSNNHFLSIIDEQDNRILEKRLPNDLSVTLKVLEPYRADIIGIAVESTFNWYWLVDEMCPSQKCAVGFSST
jgi:hypothetical protein